MSMSGAWLRPWAVVAAVAALLLSACAKPAGPSGRVSASPALLAKVDAHAAAAGVPRSIAHRVVTQESRYQPHARGRSGEWGLGQIKCGTARELGFRGPCAHLADPDVNLHYSMRYLRLALNRGWSTCAGVSLYNTGIHARPRCTAYGRQVLARRAP